MKQLKILKEENQTQEINVSKGESESSEEDEEENDQIIIGYEDSEDEHNSC